MSDFLPARLRTSPRVPGTLCALLALLGAIFVSGARGGGDFQGSSHPFDYEAEPFLYSRQIPNDAAALLDRSLRKDRSKSWVEYHPQFGYLPKVLDLLGVPPSSQMLVFSKTSLQRNHITPDNPRALYFSDDVYVGYIPGAPALEVAAVDPKWGAIFYTVNQDKDEPLRFRRSNDCLSCHGASRTMGVPGFVVRSVDTDPKGEPIPGSDAQGVTHFTPISERWGGWYVSDAPPDWENRSNHPGGEPSAGREVFEKRVKSNAYLRKGAEVLPMLVHDHQTHMHNYFTRVSFDAQRSHAMYGHLRYLRNQVDALLRYLLLPEEAPLTSPVPANPEFMEAFRKGARKDSKGRSLKDLDLQTRVFTYPCSFLIYSDSFQQLPTALRDLVLFKLWEILTCQNEQLPFSNLSQEAKTAALEILRETLPDLPSYWSEGRPE